jgi:hypothetical protein
MTTENIAHLLLLSDLRGCCGYWIFKHGFRENDEKRHSSQWIITSKNSILQITETLPNHLPAKFGSLFFTSTCKI